MIDPIHNLERTQFPVLNEPFLVDASYEFTKGEPPSAFLLEGLNPRLRLPESATDI